MDDNELNYDSFYDFLLAAKNTNKKYRYVMVITYKQSIWQVKEMQDTRHIDMTVDIHQRAFPSRNYDEMNISYDTMILTSVGNDLEVDFPVVISKEQKECICDVLRQIRQFEYEQDTFLYMPFSSYEIVTMCDQRMCDTLPQHDDEIIIGKPFDKNIEKSRRFYGSNTRIEEND